MMTTMEVCAQMMVTVETMVMNEEPSDRCYFDQRLLLARVAEGRAFGLVFGSGFGLGMGSGLGFGLGSAPAAARRRRLRRHRRSR